MNRSIRLHSGLALAALAAVAAVVVAACSGGSSSASPSSSASAQPTSAAASPTTRAGGPAAAGLIAAVTGTTMQVQSQQNGQVAVSWTDSTTFTQQVVVAATSVKVGDCITAVAPTGTDSAAVSFTATTVTVTEPIDGSCAGGATGNLNAGPRTGGSFPSGARPSGFVTGGNVPSGLPSGAQGRPGGQIAIASGSVVSVSGSTIVVAAREFTGAPNSASPSASPTTTNKTVTVDSSTKVTTNQAATAAAVEVGKCATAQGTSDSSGAVSATRISITDAVNNECTGGFTFGGRGANGANGAGGGSASPSAGGTSG